jgi:hypothetical protein
MWRKGRVVWSFYPPKEDKTSQGKFTANAWNFSATVLSGLIKSTTKQIVQITRTTPAKKNFRDLTM